MNKLISRAQNLVIKNLPIFLILPISTSLSWFLYKFALVRWSPSAAYQTHISLIQHTIGAPYRYRLLVPLIVEALIQLVPGSAESSFILAYSFYYQLSFSFSLLILYIYLKIFHSELITTFGILIVVTSLLIAFGNGYFQPWSILEIGLISLGFIFIKNNNFYYLLILTAIASFNRETGVLIPISYFLIRLRFRDNFDKKKHFIKSIALIMVWGIVFIFLRISLGTAPRLSNTEIFRINTSQGSLALTLLNIFLFLGGFWLLMIPGFKNSQRFIQRTWRIVPVYLLLYVIFGVWHEVRLLTSLYVVFIPTGLNAIKKYYDYG